MNGNKRWIGNGNQHLVVVWAKNTATNKIEGTKGRYAGWLVERGTPGFTSTVIKHKMALRPVENCNLYFQDVLRKEENRLPKATDFNKGTNVVLKHSRIFVCWLAIGIVMGAYDNVIKYVTSRKQFGQPIAGNM